MFLRIHPPNANSNEYYGIPKKYKHTCIIDNLLFLSWLQSVTPSTCQVFDEQIRHVKYL